jgi:hypothetical protein
MFLESENVAPRNGRTGFVNQGLRPCHIVEFVALVVHEFGNAVVDQLTRSFLDRSKLAGRDVRLDPRFLFGCECYRQAFLYHNSRPDSTAKSGFHSATE